MGRDSVWGRVTYFEVAEIVGKVIFSKENFVLPVSIKMSEVVLGGWRERKNKIKFIVPNSVGYWVKQLIFLTWHCCSLTVRHVLCFETKHEKLFCLRKHTNVEIYLKNDNILTNKELQQCNLISVRADDAGTMIILDLYQKLNRMAIIIICEKTLRKCLHASNGIVQNAGLRLRLNME